MRFFPFLLGLALLSAAQAQSPLRIAAAADLEPVLPPILEQFHQATGIRAEATYQASAMLTTQIINGAPFDIFLSADLSYPQKLIAAGLGDSSTPITYAKGTLVLWTRKDSPLGPPSLDLFRNPALKRLAIANPERAPYGRAAVAALTSLKLYDSLKPRLATAENISQAAQFVDSGNADAGLISLTSALTPHMASSGTLVRNPARSLPAPSARRGHHQQNNPTSRRPKVPRLPAFAADSGTTCQSGPHSRPLESRNKSGAPSFGAFLFFAPKPR